jgi:3-oxoacyl-[acyl-carrier-protein] synthase II
MLRANATAIAPIRGFSTETFSHHLGAEITATELVESEEGRRWSRVSQMAVAACREAVAGARLSDPEVLHPFGLVIGTEFGDLQSTEAFDAGFLQRGPRGLRAFLFPNTVMNSMAGIVSLALGIKGPILTLNQPGVAGELAVARALTLLAANRARAVIACGVDELFSVLYDVLGRLNMPSPQDEREEACRPFDRRHNGPVLGEGATALVVETLEHALTRGAPILAEVYSACWGAIMTRPYRYPTLAQLHHRLLDQTFAAAALSPNDVDVAYLSGSGDPRHDTAELALVAEAFGSERPLLTSVTHLSGEYGGLGALRVAAATVTATKGVLPTLSYLDQSIRSDVQFAKRPEVPSPAIVLVHGLARGGVQTALLIGPPPTQ